MKFYENTFTLALARVREGLDFTNCDMVHIHSNNSFEIKMKQILMVKLMSSLDRTLMWASDLVQGISSLSVK